MRERCGRDRGGGERERGVRERGERERGGGCVYNIVCGEIYPSDIGRSNIYETRERSERGST